jgi:citrate/tricarballylate utilization protein
VALTLVVSLASLLFWILAIVWRGDVLMRPLAGHFYDIYPHRALALVFGSALGFVGLSFGIGVRRFWRSISPERPFPSAMFESAGNVLRLRYLDGGHGKGCNDEDDAFTLRRRRFHHFTFYGFLLCIAATTVATGYHYLFGWEAPYDYFSIPVSLGSIGGISLLVGLSGQLFLNAVRAPEQRDLSQQGMDIGFMTLLYVTSLTGFAVLVGRNTRAMGLLLALHLGTVMGLFLTLPYGKFAHGIYRSAALLKWAIEKRRPNMLKLGD